MKTSLKTTLTVLMALSVFSFAGSAKAIKLWPFKHNKKDEVKVEQKAPETTVTPVVAPVSTPAVTAPVAVKKPCPCTKTVKPAVVPVKKAVAVPAKKHTVKK